MEGPHFTRRRFVAAAAGAALTGAAAPYLWSSSHARPPKAKNDRLGVAAIGTGGRGSIIGHQAGSRGDMLASCDVDRRRAEGFAERYGGRCQVLADYRRVLERNDVNVVTIATPDHWHAKIAIEAMQAGKDVYCEKPLGLTIDEGKQVCQVARDTGRVLQMGTQQRSEYGSLFLQAVALARSGRLGTKLKATASTGPAKRGGPFAAAAVPGQFDWDCWLGQAPKVDYCPQRAHYDFRWWLEYSGGKVTGWGLHHVDIALWALGLENTGPVEITGHGDFPKIANGYNVPTTFACTMTFANGAVIVLDSAANGLVIEGEKGRIEVNRRRLVGEPVKSLSQREKQGLADEVIKLYGGKRPGSHMGNFFACVADRRPPIADVFTHHRTANACHLCNIAMRLGRRLQWDPAKEDFVGDTEATAMLSRPQREPYII